MENGMSSPLETETSGTKSTPTNEPGAEHTPRSEDLATELENLEAESGPDGPTPPPVSKAGRRFVLIVTGTIPGEDLTTERDLVLKTMERAMGGLEVTHGVILKACAYRSDPTQDSGPEATATAPDAPDTSSLDAPGGESSGEESSDGSLGTPPSSLEASASPSDATSS